MTRWRAYSRASKLAGTDLGIQLLECLEPNLRRDLTRTTKGPTPIEERPQTELLAAIKATAVVEDNYMVATFAFARTTQDRGESYRSFASRLRGVAETCEFHEECANCGHVVDHSESRVSDQLCIGMADPDIQKDLMEEATKRMTVEQTLRFVEKKTTGKQAATALKAPTTPSANALDEGADREEAVNSGYKRQQQQRPRSHTEPKPLTNRPQATPPKTTDKGTCNFCGRRGHGTSSRTAIRKAQCPAYGKTCQSCGHLNHFSQLCWQTMELESSINETVHDMTEGTLPHQTWNQASGSWTQRRSPPQPTLTVAITTNRADYRAHGHTLRKEGSNQSTTALADTGCHSCLAGPPTHEKPWSGEGRHDTGITHNEIGKWQPAPHHQSSADEDQTDPVGQGDTADGIHQPYSDQTVPEPVDLHRPGVDPERLSTGTIDCIHPGRAGRGSKQTQLACRASYTQSA